MTKKDEKRFYDEVKPFIDNELSFIITEDDRNKYSCGGENRVLIERDGYNFEISKHVLGGGCGDKEKLIEYRILRTIMPYKYINVGYIFENSITESCWVHLKRSDGTMIITGYEQIKHKTNCCKLCLLYDPKIYTCAFNEKKHIKTKKHTANVLMYDYTIKETLSKKVNNDLVGEIMSFM